MVSYKERLFPEFISYVFHPVNFVLTMPFLIVYRQTASGPYALKWAIFSAMFIVLGLFFVVMGRIRGVFSDFNISKREERPKFYIMVWILACIFMGIAFVLKGVFFPLSIISFAIVIGTICIEVINNFLKISVHLTIATAWAVSIGILFGIYPFLFFLPFLFLLAWARIRLQHHTVPELIGGGIAGVIITVVTFLIGKAVYL